MSSVLAPLREPLQEVLRRFAFLDIDLHPGDVQFSAGWTLSSAVQFNGKEDESIGVLTSPEFAAEMVCNYLGTMDTPNDEQCRDVVCELANILGGSIYELLRAGRRPVVIGQPMLLSYNAARHLWNGAPESQRLSLVYDGFPVAGLLVSLPDEWTAKWA